MKNRFAFAIGILFLSLGYGFGQVISGEKPLRYEDAVGLLDATTCPLHEVVVASDTLAAAFRKADLHYPELCERKIRFQYGSAKTSMAARPIVWSIFRKRDHRKYKIIINKSRQSDQARLIYAAPFDACVGVMGHEMAHILDYSAKSGWQIMWTGIRYLGKNYRRKIERQTDSVAVVRGFGPQLYRYAYYVLHEAEIDDAYRNYKADIYMKPEEINELIKSINP